MNAYLQRYAQNLVARLGHGYISSKCPSRYPTIKRSLAASASEQPAKQRKVKHETYLKWVGQYDRKCQTVAWVDYETVSQYTVWQYHRFLFMTGYCD